LAFSLIDLLRQSYRADLAHRHVVAISQHHRIQGSPGFRAAASYVAEQVAAAGLRVVIRSYPADGEHSFWSAPGFLEWECQDATLQMLDGQGETPGRAGSAPQSTETLCDFAAIPTSLIQRSISVEGDFEVVAPQGKGGSDPADYDGLDVAGRLVLTNQPMAQVHYWAVRQRGAEGILFDGMSMGGRSDLDLPDARQYTSFWWAGPTVPDCWGFVLSPRQGRRLRAQLERGQPVRVRAKIHSNFYAGSFEVVEALIPGQDERSEEILLVSHLCHPQPGAHDNGSGAAALIETATMLARLIGSGLLPRPKRGIRFLWPPEMTGTYAWCADQEVEIRRGRWIAGLNLDMTGADQCQTGSTWQLVGLPQAAASFTDHLLSWLREPLMDGQRHQETRFSAGSDHYILSDPTVGIPTPMLSQWPDKFYHTSADTPDKISPESLARSGVLASLYAFWLASAGCPEAQWLGHLMVTRFRAQAGRDAVDVVERLSASKDTPQKARLLAEYRGQSEFRTGRMIAALDSLARLDPGIDADIRALHTEVLETSYRELRWVESQVTPDLPDGTRVGHSGHAVPGMVSRDQTSPEPQSADQEAAWRGEARRLVPRRASPGPVDAAMTLQAQGGELLPTLWAMMPSGQAGDDYHDLTALAQYWADGCRNIAEIADLVSLEVGRPASELLLNYFKLLAQAGLIELNEPS
jgi:hypothetical protein